MLGCNHTQRLPHPPDPQQGSAASGCGFGAMLPVCSAEPGVGVSVVFGGPMDGSIAPASPFEAGRLARQEQRGTQEGLRSLFYAAVSLLVPRNRLKSFPPHPP